MSVASIEVNGLTKRFGKRRAAVRDVTFRFEGNGAIGYLGPNGAGKSTTLKLLVGLLRPTSGEVRLNGHDPDRDHRAALSDVGAVIESPEPYPTMTVFDALETVGTLRGLTSDGVDSEIDRWHAALELPTLGARCGRLSKGERQRVVLAAALMGDPSVLLLDEPTSGLDPAERVIVRNLLGRLKKDHLILMSSHLMGDITEVCDELLFLRRGRVVLRDRVEAVAARITLRQIDVEFLGAVPRAALERLSPLVRDIVEVTDRRYRVTFDGSRNGRAEVLDCCRTIAPVVRFTDATLVLEEAYLDVIGSAPDETAPGKPQRATDSMSGPSAELGSASPTSEAAPEVSVAREYRRRRAARRAPWKWTALEVAVFAVVVGIVYLATTPTPAAPSASPGPGSGSSASPEIDLDLDGPQLGNVSCGTPQNYSTERFIVENLTAPLYTNDVELLVVELGDNDIISTVGTSPGVTADSVCTGPAPTGVIGWYGVLSAPSGSVLGAFTYADGWAPVAGAQYPGPIMNGSAFTVVLSQPIAGFGYGLEVTGVENGPPVSGGGIL